MARSITIKNLLIKTFSFIYVLWFVFVNLVAKVQKKDDRWGVILFHLGGNIAKNLVFCSHIRIFASKTTYYYKVK